MYILTVRAFADFDIPYTVNLGAFNSLVRVNYLKDNLNNWVKKHPKVDCDIRISDIFENEKYKNEFIETCKFALISAVSVEDIVSFVDVCFKGFQENYVYLNTDIFDVEEIKVIF
jgi:hypothetical protein